VSWCWFALVDAPAADATAQAAVASGGWLAAWQRHAKPVRHARRIDARIIDPDGESAWVSLVLPPEGVRVAFDDVAVQQARRAVLARPPVDAVSTLLSDASHFEGSITVMRGRMVDDPFARIFAPRLLQVEAGLFGRVPPPCGPTIERYGSAQPWPWDRYEVS
jgi:hypothetical protein